MLGRDYEDARMQQSQRRSPAAEKQARYRQGVAHQLKSLDAKIDDLSGKLDAVLAAKLVRKSISNSECHNGD
jgi:hypothetical protein